MSTENAYEAIRARLLSEADDLRSQLSELGFGDTGEGAGLDYDSNFADTSQVMAERGEAANLAGSLRESLADIEHAVAKFANKTFGSCENCGNAIPETRLDAMPTSKHCIDCVSSR